MGKANIADIVKEISDKITITIGRPEVDKAAEAEAKAKTKEMLAVINAENKDSDKLRKKLQKLAKAALAEKYPSLLDQIYQYSNKDSMEVNAANEIVYTFNLQPEFAFLESMLASRLEDVNVTFDHQTNTYTVSCKVEIHER